MIEVENLTKTYGDFVAVENVSFHVERGEILGFLGPNGAGKTTTMRILTAYMPPSVGTARVAGYDVFADSLEVRKRVGYMPETVPLYPEMTVRSYLDFVAALRATEDRRQAVEKAMEVTNIGDRAADPIGELSKGLKQRVGLAQALVHDPEVLILDEPTLGLDPKQIIEARDLIRSLGGERTIILSTHILPEASEVCSRVLIINKGHIVAEDTPERLTERLKGAERLLLQVAKPAPDALAVLSAVPGVMAVALRGSGEYELEYSLSADCRPQIAATVVQQGWELLEMRNLTMSLEEIFLQLTTE
jgi:ABC-2 type transport system ATP-binding protein